MRRVAWTGIVIGLGMALQWGGFLVSGQVPELQTEPWRIGFHLAAEALTALALITAGVLLLRGVRAGRSLALVANGMLLYTAVVSPGYFAQGGEWGLVVMFALIVVAAVGSILGLVRG